jgi:ATP phosphoribosyltransferase regulatory subunit
MATESAPPSNDHAAAADPSGIASDAGARTCRPPSLEHPLPAGMRDLLPEEAQSRRAIARKVLESFALHGYALVTPPAFEFADVLERGLGTLDPADVLRFVEPESGEVAALRPDMTPQIARMIATRLRAMPPPFRLCYEGTVLRRRSGRARKHRQIPQVGVELAGVAAPQGDLELLAVAADALRAAGLERFAIDLGDAGVVRALLVGMAPPVAERISGALSRKDEAQLAEVAQGSAHGATLRALLGLHGGRDAIVEGTHLLAATPAAEAAARLLEVFDAASAHGLAPHLVADLGEVRGFAYYTGPIFHILAPGPGEAIASGGRYDELLARFGAPMPAVGFAIDLDRLSWALREAGVAGAQAPRVVVVGRPDDPALARLRARGVTAVAMADATSALAWARAWRYTHVVQGAQCIDVASGATMASPFDASLETK